MRSHLLLDNELGLASMVVLVLVLVLVYWNVWKWKCLRFVLGGEVVMVGSFSMVHTVRVHVCGLVVWEKWCTSDD